MHIFINLIHILLINAAREALFYLIKLTLYKTSKYRKGVVWPL